VNNLTAYRRRQAGSLAKRKTELTNMQGRLLNAYLVGTVEETVFKAKSNELKAETAKALAQLGDTAPAQGETALALFDWTQRVADAWRGSNPTIRREILDCVCLNRTLGDVSLCLAKRKPFDVFAEGLDLKNSRGDWRSFEPGPIYGVIYGAIVKRSCILVSLYRWRLDGLPVLDTYPILALVAVVGSHDYSVAPALNLDTSEFFADSRADVPN
jgi:hypothetical protein